MSPFSQQPSDWITVLGLAWLLNNQISAIMANNENVRVASFQIVDGQLVWVQTEKAIEEHQSYTKVSTNNLFFIKSSEFEFEGEMNLLVGTIKIIVHFIFRMQMQYRLSS